MTRRSIQAGAAPRILIHAGADVCVHGVAGERVLVETSGMWGFNLKRGRSEIKVEIGSSGDVWVPSSSSVKAYAGKSISMEEIAGEVTAYSGWNLTLSRVGCVAHAQAGGAMEIDCRRVSGKEVTFSAGRDLRIAIKSMVNTWVKVKDMRGAREARFGRPEAGKTAPLMLTFKAGGEVILVAG